MQDSCLEFSMLMECPRCGAGINGNNGGDLYSEDQSYQCSYCHDEFKFLLVDADEIGAVARMEELN